MAKNQKRNARVSNARAFNVRPFDVRLTLRQYGPHLLGLVIVILLVHNVFGAHGFLALHRTRFEIKKTELQLENLNKENLKLEQEVKDLKTDPRLIEKIAREDSQLARPGEIIIRMPANPQPPQSASVKP
jgi:cell division protein FtsB